MAEATYELCYDPHDGDALIYRSIPAGICGPFSEPVPCKSRQQAEIFARTLGYTVVGDWESHPNYDSVSLVTGACVCGGGAVLVKEAEFGPLSLFRDTCPNCGRELEISVERIPNLPGATRPRWRVGVREARR